jgi:hypothetical protein
MCWVGFECVFGEGDGEKSSPNWVLKAMVGVRGESKFTKMNPWGVM